MHITYLSGVRIPNEKASGLAIMRQCEAFASLGHTVTLVAPDRDDVASEDAFDYYGVARVFALTFVPVIPLYFAYTRFKLLGFILKHGSLMASSLWYVLRNRRQIDVVYARDHWLLVCILFIFPRARIICEMHTMHRGLLARFVTRSVGQLVVISQGLADDYGALTKRSDILLEPSGADITQFQGLPPSETLRKSYRIPEHATVFGYIGKYTTMGEEKGVRELIESFAQLHTQYTNVHMLVAGLETREEQEVKDLFSSLGVSNDAYTLLPLQSKIFAHLVRACDVLLMNYPDTPHYRLYMSPSKLVAYMAGGRLIVSSNLPSVQSLLAETEAILFTPGSKKAIDDAFMKAYKRVQEHGASVTYAVDRYSWQQRGRRILSPYKS